MNYGILTVKYGNFIGNSATYVCVHLLCSWPGFSQLFFSFLTFVLLFAQNGGAIVNYGILTVEHGNFTGNSAQQVCYSLP